MLTALVFGSSLTTPADTIPPRVNNLFALQSAESAAFPNVTALRATHGVCRSESAEMIKEDLTVRIAVARESARLQTEHSIIAYCLQQNLLPAAPDSDGNPEREAREEINRVMVHCRRLTDNPVMWDRCFLGLTSGSGAAVTADSGNSASEDTNIESPLGDYNLTNVPTVTEEDLVWCRTNWSLPLAPLTQVEIDADLIKGELLRGIEARSSFDQSYSERRLKEVRAFFDVMAAFFLRIATINDDVDSYISASFNYTQEAKLQCELSRDQLFDVSVDLKNNLFEVATEWAGRFADAVQDWLNRIAGPDGWLDSINNKFGDWEPGGVTSPIGDSWEDILRVLRAAFEFDFSTLSNELRIEFKIPSVKIECSSFKVFGKKIKFCWPEPYLADASVPDPFKIIALEALAGVIKLSTPVDLLFDLDLDFPSMPDIEFSLPDVLPSPSPVDFPSPDLPGPPGVPVPLELPSKPLPVFPSLPDPELPEWPDMDPPEPENRVEPPEVPYELLEGWFGDDYNPPEILDAEFNATIEAALLEPPVPEIPPVNQSELFTFDAAGISAPDVDFSSIWWPSFPALGFLSAVILIETLALLAETLITLLRAGALPEPALEVFVKAENLNKSAKDRRLNRWQKLLLPIANCFSPTCMMWILFLVPWTMFMLVYYTILYGPVQDANSYVYNTGAAFTLEHSIFEATIYQRFNKDLSAITTLCQAGREEHAREVDALIQELDGWLRSLGVSGAFAVRDLGLPDFIPDAGDYFSHLPTQPELPTTAADICHCERLTYTPVFSTERRIAAAAADAQGFVVANAYVLKAHFVLILMVLLRVARFRLVRLYAIVVSYFGSPRMMVDIRGPLYAVLEDPDRRLPAFKRQKNAFMRSRHKAFAKAILWLLVSLAMVWIIAYVNRAVDVQLVNPLGAISCTGPEDCANFAGGPEVYGKCSNAICREDIGVCTLEPVVCDDGDDCTHDYCDAEDGCLYALASECRTIASKPLPACFSDLELCNDGAPCTRDVCVVDVDEGARQGADVFGCTHFPIDCSGAGVDNACTTNATCNPLSGVCETERVDCDDNNGCTDDYCNSDTGCENIPVECAYHACYPSQCVEQPSTGSGTCEPVEWEPEDGHNCTIELCDVDLGWTVMALHAECNDGQYNTTNYCTTSGCVTIPSENQDGGLTDFLCPARDSSAAACQNCTSGFDGSTCSQCKPGHYGLDCLPCGTDCIGERWCDDGIDGEGCLDCGCNGQRCVNLGGVSECLCPANRKGPDCAECADGHEGEACLPIGL